jgi:hypothetical protein
MPLTRIPYGAPSSAAQRVRPPTACFDATYGALVGPPRMPAIDAVLTMAPEPCGFMTRSTARRPRNTPRASTAMTESNSSTASSVIGPTGLDAGVVEEQVDRSVML